MSGKAEYLRKLRILKRDYPDRIIATDLDRDDERKTLALDMHLSVSQLCQLLEMPEAVWQEWSAAGFAHETTGAAGNLGLTSENLTAMAVFAWVLRTYSVPRSRRRHVCAVVGPAITGELQKSIGDERVILSVVAGQDKSLDSGHLDINTIPPDFDLTVPLNWRARTTLLDVTKMEREVERALWVTPLRLPRVSEFILQNAGDGGGRGANATKEAANG